jgi:hypothetical protein
MTDISVLTGIPEGELQPFMAMAQGVVDYAVEVVPMKSEQYGDLMAVIATAEAVYITKDQAKRFFNLVEK